MMPRGRFTIDEVLHQVLADSNSKEEDMQCSSKAQTDITVLVTASPHALSPQSAHGIAGASLQVAGVEAFCKRQAGNVVEVAGGSYHRKYE